MTNLYLFGRKEDLAFEQPVGDSPRHRHHVRFWRAEKAAADARPVWVGPPSMTSESVSAVPRARSRMSQRRMSMLSETICSNVWNSQAACLRPMSWMISTKCGKARTAAAIRGN